MDKRTEAAAVVALLDEEYRRATGALRSALKAFMQGGAPPSAKMRSERVFTYPNCG